MTYKNLKIKIFYLIYGKIKKIIKAKEKKEIKIKKIVFTKKIFYNLFNVPNGRLYSDTVHDTAIISKESLIQDASFQYRVKKNLRIVNGKIKDNTVIKHGTPKLLKNIKGSVFSLLCGGAAKNNYWHWIFDVLPKIGILEKSNLNIKPDFYLLPSFSKNYQKQTFLKMGIPISKLLDGEKFKHFICDNLITVDHPIVFNNNPSDSIQDIPEWIIKWLRKKFITSNLVNSKLPKKIFINRENESSSHNRKIVNIDEVKKLLIDQGFEILTLSTYNFKEQVEIFKAANFIVGLHGAGLTNVVFSKPRHTTVLEIQSTTSGEANSNLIKKCKLNYKRISEKNTSPELKYQNSHIIVNLTKLKKIISS
jgi:capsular polysaccharide biosynthesis protein